MSTDFKIPCGQCGSPLIPVDQITEHREGERTAIVRQTYKCSNQVCQDKIDKDTAERIKSREERERAKEARIPFNKRNNKSATPTV